MIPQPAPRKTHARGLRVAWVFALALHGSAAWSDIVVHDDLGAEVRLPAPARRIISLAPHATEQLFAAGAGKYVVGAVQYSDYPPAAKKIPRVGGYRALDFERILALRPDLVVAWASGNGARTIDKLRALGLRVYQDEPRTLRDVAKGIERLGHLAGTDKVAAAAGRAFRRHLARLRKRYRHRAPVSVFYEIWNRPLMTVNGKHLISRVIRLCGGRNVFAGLGTLAPTVGVEAVLAANPQAIIASGMDEERPQWLQDWRRWPQLRAVRNKHLFFIPPDLMQRQGPRILEGAERMCQILDRVRREQPPRHTGQASGPARPDS